MAATPRTLFFLPSSSCLSEDYILTANIPVKPLTSGAPFAVFHARHRRPEALVILEDSALYYVYRDYSNAAGWSIQSLAAGITSVVAGSDGSGTVTAFYTDDTALYQVTLGANGWSAPAQLPWCNQLRVTNVPMTEELVAYGVTSQGSLQVMRENNRVWSASTVTMPASLAGAAPVMAFNSSTAWTLAAKNTGGASQMELYTGSGSSYSSGPMAVAIPAPVGEILLGYIHGASALFLFTDTGNNLYANYNFTNQFTVVPNALVTRGSAVLDKAGLLHVYCVTPGNQLWVLHQTAWSNTAGPVWAPAIPLDVDIASVSVSTGAQTAPHFMAVGQDNFLKQYTLDPAKRVWRGSLVQQPSEKAFYVNQYRTEITVIDSSGNPVPDVPVSIVAEVECALAAGQVVYPVGPQEPAVINTNNLGKITIATVATQMSSPALTVTADGVAKPMTVNPDRQVTNWLNGKGPLNYAGALNGATLLAGTQPRDGSPLAPRLRQVPAKAQKLVADAAANGVINVMQIQPGGASPGGMAGFALDLSDPASPAYTVFETSRELETYHAGLFSVGSSLTNIWNDVEGFAEDVWHGIETAATTVWHWVVDVANGVASLVVKIGDQFYSMLNMVLEGLEDVLSLAMSIFNALEAFVDKLINFVLALFDWGAMWNTTLAFEQALTGAFPWAIQTIGAAQSKLDKKFFDELKVRVARGFTFLKRQYGGGQSMESLVSAFCPPVSSTHELTGSRAFSLRPMVSGSAGAVCPASVNANVQSGWMLDKVLVYAGDLPAPPGQPPSIKQAFDEFVQQLEKAGTEVFKSLEDFGKFFLDTVKDPRDFTSLALIDLLNAVESLALGVVDLVQLLVDAFLNLVLIGLDWIKDFLTAPMEIPLVSELFRLFQKVAAPQMPPQPMSIANLMCLVLAVPVTLGYETAYGLHTQPFPDGKLTAEAASLSAAPGTAAVEPSLESSGALASATQFAAALVSALWGLVNTALDSVPETSWWPFTAAGVVVPMLINVLTWPTGVPFTTVPVSSEADIANLINWLAGWMPIGVDISFIVVDPMARRLARYNEAVGMVVMSLAGAFNMGTGIAACIEGRIGLAQIAGNLLSPCGNMLQFLRAQTMNVEDAEIPYGIKLLVDFFTGEGAAIAIAAE